MSDYAHTLGDAIKRARRKSGLSQSEVAAAANIDVRTVFNIWLFTLFLFIST